MGGIACRRPGYRGGDSVKAVPSSPIARKFAADTNLRSRVRVYVRVYILPAPLPTHRPCLSSATRQIYRHQQRQGSPPTRGDLRPAEIHR